MGEVKHTPHQIDAVLRQVGKSSGPIATHWMDRAAGCPGNTAKVRRLLKRLERLGQVEGVGYGGVVRWWKITADGRAALARAGQADGGGA